VKRGQRHLPVGEIAETTAGQREKINRRI